MINFIRDAVDGIKCKCDKFILHKVYYFPPSASHSQIFLKIDIYLC